MDTVEVSGRRRLIEGPASDYSHAIAETVLHRCVVSRIFQVVAHVPRRVFIRYFCGETYPFGRPAYLSPLPRSNQKACCDEPQRVTLLSSRPAVNGREQAKTSLVAPSVFRLFLVSLCVLRWGCWSLNVLANGARR